jgi:hypothetical protein
MREIAFAHFLYWQVMGVDNEYCLVPISTSIFIETFFSSSCGLGTRLLTDAITRNAKVAVAAVTLELFRMLLLRDVVTVIASDPVSVFI